MKIKCNKIKHTLYFYHENFFVYGNYRYIIYLFYAHTHFLEIGKELCLYLFFVTQSSSAGDDYTDNSSVEKKKQEVLEEEYEKKWDKQHKRDKANKS